MKKLLFLMLTVSLFTACSTDEDETEFDNPEVPVAKCEIIEVSGKISEPTVWKEGFVYVINGSGLSVESVLTIEPGVIVKLKNAGISIYEEGKILANGTADKRIVFTSLADDRYCGDTNGDGVATKAEKGDWIDLDLHGTIGSVFKYVDIFFAGQPSGGNNHAVVIGWAQSVAFTFDHCRIAHTFYQPGSSSYAFYGSSYMKDASVSKFTNNALYDNGKPIYFQGYYQLDQSNVFHNPEVPSVTNKHNGIYIDINGASDGLSVNWDNTEVPYVYEQVNLIGGTPTATINIKPNVIVKFSYPTGGLQSYNGSVKLAPTAILTSYKDDTHGGDTNGDGNTTTPSNGDWKGFRITDGGTNTYWEQGSNILYSAN